MLQVERTANTNAWRYEAAWCAKGYTSHLVLLDYKMLGSVAKDKAKKSGKLDQWFSKCI